jgi:dipeptidyl aminopeptidase/acylaminoacyl peptidase
MRVVLLIVVLTAPMRGFSPRLITVGDCVRTRRIMDGEVQLSPDGSRVAYVVKSPNLETNRNDYELFVRDLSHPDVRENGRMLLGADRVSGIRWVDSNRLLALVENRQNGEAHSQIALVDAVSGTHETLDLPGDTNGFSATADGGKIVFSVQAPTEDDSKSAREQKVREERGYAVDFAGSAISSRERLAESFVFLATKNQAGKFDVRKLQFTFPKASTETERLRGISGLTLSPNGKYLLLVYSSPSLPAEWAKEPYFRYLKSRGSPFYSYELGLYNLGTGELQSAFNFPSGFLKSKWSADSRFYSVASPSPFGTRESGVEQQGAQANGDFDQYLGRFEHVFVVDPENRRATKVVAREDSELLEDLPLSWREKDGPMLVRTNRNTVAWMSESDGRWRSNSEFMLPSDESFPTSLQSDGTIVIGVHQTTTTPPDLFWFDLATGKWQLLTDLNPEFREIELGQVEPISWSNRYGSKCAGYLIKPVGYQAGKRYPMVLLSAPPRNVFISDAVYTTAYAPQSLASAGFVVLVSQYPLDNRIPRGRFPGEMSSAYNWMAMVESAVDLLTRRGLVDPQNVGLAGFSRTSWLTDFTLTHSAYHFTAASSADSGIYTYGGYFRYNSRGQMIGAETQVGGPPYGKTLSDWLAYAPPFNADKVGAAVLMEYTGAAEHGLEFFTALSRLGKAVEFYRYPNGAHPLDTPFERVASLQRNVDWFRFWMEGYEGKAPEYDPSQYDRWRTLRARRAEGEPINLEDDR